MIKLAKFAIFYVKLGFVVLLVPTELFSLIRVPICNKFKFYNNLARFATDTGTVCVELLVAFSLGPGPGSWAILADSLIGFISIIKLD